jgi:hypothetical protein
MKPSADGDTNSAARHRRPTGICPIFLIAPVFDVAPIISDVLKNFTKW